MARRKNKSALGIVLVVLVAMAGLTFLGSLLWGFHRTKPHLNLHTYTENPVSLAGNAYYLEGTVRERLARNTSGTVFFVETQDGSPAAVVIPQKNTPAFNIEKGQKLAFDVLVADDGSLLAIQTTKK